MRTLYPTDGTTPDQRKGMKMLWWDGVFASVSMGFYLDFEVLYLLALGAGSAVIGARASINSAVSLLAPLLAAWLVERTGKRKLWVLLSGGGLSRMCLFLIFLLPFFSQGRAAVLGLMTLMALRAFSDALIVPPYNSLLGDLVPSPIRGRYIGSKMMYGSLARTLTVLLAGLLVAHMGGITGYQFTMLVAAGVGFVATSFYARLPEPEGIEGGGELRGRAGFGDGLRFLRGDRRFLIFCVLSLIWTIGNQLAAPFFSVHMVENLGFGVGIISLLSALTTLISVVAVRLAGQLVDRKGASAMTAVGMLLVPFMPVAWIFARTPFQVGLARVYGALAWASVLVAEMPLQMYMTPPEHRSQFIAILRMIVQLGTILGPIPASYIFARWGFRTNLVWSAAVRMVGALIFLAMFLYGAFRSGYEEEPARS